MGRNLQQSGLYTTGDVARICHVAPRTAAKWADTGRLPGTYRIPGSNDRRIPAAALLAFLRDNRMPLGELAGMDRYVVLLATTDARLVEQVTALLPSDLGYDVLPASTWLAVGEQVGAATGSAFVIDFAMGSSEAMRAAPHLARAGRLLLALLGEDWGEGPATGYDASFRKPFAIADLAEKLATHRRRHLPPLLDHGERHRPLYVSWGKAGEDEIRRLWATTEEARLNVVARQGAKAANRMACHEAAMAMNRTYNAVRAKARELGLLMKEAK